MNFDIATLLLRLTVGAFMLPHGLQKFGLMGGDRNFEIQAFDALGLRPAAFWSALAGVAQIGLGLLLVLGLFTQIAGAATAVLMLAAAVMGLRNNGWYWQKQGLEYALFWTLTAFVVSLLGPGPWSLDQMRRADL